jgi:hypothetical protein
MFARDDEISCKISVLSVSSIPLHPIRTCDRSAKSMIGMIIFNSSCLLISWDGNCQSTFLVIIANYVLYIIKKTDLWLGRVISLLSPKRLPNGTHTSWRRPVPFQIPTSKSVNSDTWSLTNFLSSICHSRPRGCLVGHPRLRRETTGNSWDRGTTLMSPGCADPAFRAVHQCEDAIVHPLSPSPDDSGYLISFQLPFSTTVHVIQWMPGRVCFSGCNAQLKRNV